MATFETPKWLQAEASRMYLRQTDVGARLEPTLTDDQVIEIAMKVAEDLNRDYDDEAE